MTFVCDIIAASAFFSKMPNAYKHIYMYTYNHHAWTDQNFLTGIGRSGVKNKFYKYFFKKVQLKCMNSVYSIVINDNNNFAHSIFQS